MEDAIAKAERRVGPLPENDWRIVTWQRLNGVPVAEPAESELSLEEFHRRAASMAETRRELAEAERRWEAWRQSVRGPLVIPKKKRRLLNPKRIGRFSRATSPRTP